LPLLLLFVFATIEITDSIFLKQILAIAAYEGARSAAEPGALAQTAREKAEEILAQHGVQGANVSVTPEVGLATIRGTNITVTVSAPCAEFSTSPLSLFSNHDVEKSVQIVRN
jgi:Flp pilus assembly protein TadG